MNEFIEKLIISGGQQDKMFLATISSVYEKQYFEDETVGNIFVFMKEHLEKYGTIAPRDVIINMVENSQGIFEHIDSIQFDMAKNYEYLFDQTNQHLKDRAIKDAILKSVDIINKGPDQVGQIQKVVEEALCKDLRIDLGLNYFESIKDRLRRIFTNVVKRVPTFLPQFDEYITGGFPPYTLSVFVARIHGWKSSMLANLSARQALHGYTVILMTLEMSQDAFAQRFDSIYTGLDINKMYFIPTEQKRLIDKLANVKSTEGRGNLYIKEFPTGEASILDMKRYIRELIMRGVKPDIIYVDYINLMKPSYGNKSDLYSDVKRIAEELRAMSFLFNIPVISVSQLNREGSSIDLRSLDFVFISESMGLPATADFMTIFGEDDEQMIYASELSYKIVKNRIGGRVGEINKFFYDTRSLKLYDVNELDVWLEDSNISGDDRKLAEQRDRRRE